MLYPIIFLIAIAVIEGINPRPIREFSSTVKNLFR